MDGLLLGGCGSDVHPFIEIKFDRDSMLCSVYFSVGISKQYEGVLIPFAQLYSSGIN